MSLLQSFWSILTLYPDTTVKPQMFAALKVCILPFEPDLRGLKFAHTASKTNTAGDLITVLYFCEN